MGAKPVHSDGAAWWHWRKARIEIAGEVEIDFSRAILFELDIETYIFTEKP